MDEDKLIEATNTFSIELYNKLKEPTKNLFFSPFSIYTVLAMVYAGARGSTEKQMRDILNINLEQNRFQSEFKKLLRIFYDGKGSELNLANLVCIQEDYSVLEKFLWIIDDIYNGAIWELDFNAVKESCAKINAWVAEKTQGKILNILDSIDENMGIIVVNAIYFKGAWEYPFKERLTEDDSFTLSSGEKISVPMMHQTDKFRFLEEDGFKILEMPYKGERVFGTYERISMVIFLPDKNDGLEELENLLTYNTIMNQLSKLQKLWERKIKIIFPKFKFETKYELLKPLYDLGLVDAFSDNADFSGIAKDPPESISRIIHKAFVDVNERGTEAAAVTALRILGGSLGPIQKPPEFRADHPFLFFLIDSKTKTILFIGKLTNPLDD